MKPKQKPKKSFYRWIEVTDYGRVPRTHGEYSNKPIRLMGAVKRVKITILD